MNSVKQMKTVSVCVCFIVYLHMWFCRLVWFSVCVHGSGFFTWWEVRIFPTPGQGSFRSSNPEKPINLWSCTAPRQAFVFGGPGVGSFSEN